MRRLAASLRIATALGALCVAAAAQDPPAGGDRVAGELRPESIQARIDAAQAAEGLQASDKAQLLAAFQRALDAVKDAEVQRGKATDYEAAIAGAGDRLAATRAEIARLAAAAPRQPDAATPSPQLETELAALRAEALKATAELREIEQESVARIERRALVPAQIDEARRQIDELDRRLEAPLEADASESARAERLALRASRDQLEARRRALELELQSYAARGELLAARRDLATLSRSYAERAVGVFESAIQQKRQDEASREEREARQAIQDAERLHPALGELARANLALRQERTAVERAIESLTGEGERARETLQSLDNELETTKKRIKAAGLTEAISLLLRQHRARVATTIEQRRRAASRSARIAEIQLHRIDLEDEQRSLGDVAARVDGILALLDRAVPETELNAVRAEAQRLLEARRNSLRALITAEDRYLETLVGVDTTEKQILAKAREYAQYIDERVLWIRSHQPLWRARFHAIPNEIDWFLSAAPWRALARAFWGDAVEHLLWLGFGAAVVGALIVWRRRLLARLAACGERAAKKNATAFPPSLEAFGLSVLIALPGPLSMLLLGWRFGATSSSELLPRGLAHAFVATGWVYLVVDLLRQIARPSGLGEAHFGWTPLTLVTVRRQLRRFVTWVLPVVFLVLFVNADGGQTALAPLGRSLFIVLMLALALLFGRVLHPSAGVFSNVTAAGNWLRRTRHVWLVLSVGGAVALAILDAVGYHFTALQLFEGLEETVGLVMALVVGHALVFRWLTLTRRRLQIEQARERRRIAKEQSEAGTDASSSEVPETPPEVDLATINDQTRGLLNAAVTLIALLGAWSIWVDVLPALGVLREVHLWSDVVSETLVGDDGVARAVERVVPITLAELLLAVIVLIATIVAAKNIPGALDIALLRRLPIQPGERYAVATVSRYIIALIGVVLAFSTLGLGWSKVQWLAAAVTVGLGFGLQEIFANFVSGLIILFEQPIRLGDIVSVGTVDGKVARIRMRSTTIVDWDRRELIVPNKEFITGQVINWTLSDPITRVVVPVGIAYGSDTRLARRILLDVAKQSPFVLDEPAPAALFRSFGDSALIFELRVFLPDRGVWPDLVHELHTEIDDAFKEHGIEIAFPQRDLHIRSAEPLQRMVEKSLEKARPLEEFPPTT